MGDTVSLLGGLHRRGAPGGGPLFVWLKLRFRLPIPESAPGRGLTAIILRPRDREGAASDSPPFSFRRRRSGARARLGHQIVMDDATLHAAGDRDHLAGDMTGEHVGGENDDLGGHIVGLSDLAQGHRP